MRYFAEISLEEIDPMKKDLVAADLNPKLLGSVIELIQPFDSNHLELRELLKKPIIDTRCCEAIYYYLNDNRESEIICVSCYVSRVWAEEEVD